ncbi:unnamed protein product [Spirodela intermedia]|uniref:Uncharacterized protein n=1 Tax=Spirodela intermedia TaxID=51605 RepID=A0A7I8IXE2_SPIIN|nr:unnamed protein product [Spirodela intermedia]CAA6662527.1 unnamed protein product [Spirodela intermedia]
MDSEIAVLVTRETWDLVPRPTDVNIVMCNSCKSLDEFIERDHDLDNTENNMTSITSQQSRYYFFISNVYTLRQSSCHFYC